MIAMANAATQQALEEFKKRLREFLESTADSSHRGIAMPGKNDIPMKNLDGYGRTAAPKDDDDDEI